MRDVCFSPPKRKQFAEFSASSPVNFKKFRINTKSNAEDSLLEIEPFPQIPFAKEDVPDTMTRGMLTSICPGQLISRSTSLRSKMYENFTKVKIQRQKAKLLIPGGFQK